MIRRYCFSFLLMASLLRPADVWAWGGSAHRFINQNAVKHLPLTMTELAAQKAFLTDHASDADSRKSSDPSEYPKHFIDLESYTDFQHLPADMSIVVARYGWPAVESYGILPWTIADVTDSLTEQFRRGDWAKAVQSAADLGHYVGDACQPLHCTVNYDGQLTGNPGIHSQYESRMLGQYLSTLSVAADSVTWVGDVYAFALGTTIRSNAFVDSIMQADSAARAVSGWTGSGTPPPQYYTTLWAQTGAFTERLLQEATRDIASLWYTAWVNAAAPISDVAPDLAAAPPTFSLEQNYPNPFNPKTVISCQLSVASRVRLVVYDLLGREVAVLLDEQKAPGRYQVEFDGTHLSSGVYVYRLTAGSYVDSKRMLLLK